MTKIERIIYNLRPVVYVINKGKQWHVPGTKGLSFYDVIQTFIQQANTVGIGDRAAVVAFNFIMAIPSAVIFLCTLVPYLPISRQFYTELSRIINNLTPSAEVRLFVMDFMDDFFNKPKGGLLSIGFILAIYYSSNAVMGVMRTFDRSLPEKYSTNFIEKRLRAIRLTAIIILLVIGCILISLGQGAFFQFIMHSLGIHSEAVRLFIKSSRWVLILALFLYSIGFIYKYAPTVKDRWRILSPGAVLGAGLTIVVMWVLAIWIEKFSNYNSIYGPIGTLLIIMLTVYINSYILLIGFEFNVVIGMLKKKVNSQ